MTTEMIRRILVPTDLSDFSKAAARWALLFQRRLGAHITLLYANQPYFAVNAMEGPAAYSLPTSPDLTERARHELQEFSQECFPDADRNVDILLVEAAPAGAILRAAAEIDADLILMGTHGRHGLSRALLGSVTESVVRATDRPLMSVPAMRPASLPPEIRRILCPVNFTSIARQALEEAVALARAFDAELLIVHVPEAGDGREPRTVERDFAAWVEPELRDQCIYSRIVAQGDAAEQVLHLADLEVVDLIVIGAQHKRFRDHTIIGTTTERVVRYSRQPVWTVVATPVTEAREPVDHLMSTVEG